MEICYEHLILERKFKNAAHRYKVIVTGAYKLKHCRYNIDALQICLHPSSSEKQVKEPALCGAPAHCAAVSSRRATSFGGDLVHRDQDLDLVNLLQG